MTRLKFKLGQRVGIKCSGEHGAVIARAEYAEATPNYYVRYASADGRAVEKWWGEEALGAILENGVVDGNQPK